LSKKAQQGIPEMVTYVTDTDDRQHRSILQRIGHRAMLERGLVPGFLLSVAKLMGAGEYVVELPGGRVAGYFGLAVNDYAHSRAPNRRCPDLITQRLLKAVVTGRSLPYENDELKAFARHCTEEEGAAKKIERQVTTSAAAVLLESRIGGQFDAIVTGASDKGMWARLLHPPIEGSLESGFGGMDVGHRLGAQLVGADVERGYMDFERVV
jgi:exoribonuclease-2